MNIANSLHFSHQLTQDILNFARRRCHCSRATMVFPNFDNVMEVFPNMNTPQIGGLLI